MTLGRRRPARYEARENLKPGTSSSVTAAPPTTWLSERCVPVTVGEARRLRVHKPALQHEHVEPGLRQVGGSCQAVVTT